MLTPKLRVAAIARALVVSEPSETRTVGGSAETEANAVTVIPHGLSPTRQVTSTTPLASVLIASAKSETARTRARIGELQVSGMGRLLGERLAAAWSAAANRCGRGHAVATSTVTGTPFVTMSKTAERCCARATTSRSFSSGASPSTRKETRICSKPLR